MTEEHETTTETPEMTAYSLGTQPLPSPWQSVVYAFRQARLVRLEARVQRLRRQTVETSLMCISYNFIGQWVRVIVV